MRPISARNVILLLFLTVLCQALPVSERTTAMPALGKAERSHILARLERLHTLLDQLKATKPDPARIERLRKVMFQELISVKKAVKKLPTSDRRKAG